MRSIISFACLLIMLQACSKSGNQAATVTGWVLVQKDWSSAREFISEPAADSAVLLKLDNNGNYVSLLNGQTVCEGSYTISTDSYQRKYIQFNGFKTTGIFALFTLIQEAANGQVLSVITKMGISQSADTLRISSLPTPGGMLTYTFIKN